MPTYKLNINKITYNVEADENMPLLWVLRDLLNLVGTKFGCGIGQCGACTIHFDGIAIRSCLIPIQSVGDSKITTIEGLSNDNSHPVQRAWKEEDVPQCGYCQAGQIMTASAFLAENKNPSLEEVRSAMHGNLCRCSAYNRIEKAVYLASKMKTK